VLSECLYRAVFCSFGYVRTCVTRFVSFYNTKRPHLAIGGSTPWQRLAGLMAA
jgi:transposase InsO family protein